MAVVVVAATNASRADSDSRQVVDALAATAPLFEPQNNILPAGHIMVVYLSVGAALFAALACSWPSATLRDFADKLGCVQ